MPLRTKVFFFSGILLALIVAALALFLWFEPDQRETVSLDIELQPVGFADLPDWNIDQKTEALAAFQRTCVPLLKLKDEHSLGARTDLWGHVADWREVCVKALNIESDARLAHAFFEEAFVPFKVIGKSRGDGLFTGYFEPQYAAARAKSRHYAVPVYAPPNDLVRVDTHDFGLAPRQRFSGRVIGGRLVPYHTRRDISAGALAGKTRVVAWMSDPVEAFFMHIQGSARLRFDDGYVMRVGYAADNGHQYTAIGKTLIDKGALEAQSVSMQSIQAWLRQNTPQAADVMAQNARYIFFAPQPVSNPELGPIGAARVPLTPARSLAVDLSLHALGIPMWVDTILRNEPNFLNVSKGPMAAAQENEPNFSVVSLRRLMIAQDTGAAIKGAVRGDIFFGSGPDAGEIAGRMDERGALYVLLPRALAARHSGS